MKEIIYKKRLFKQIKEFPRYYASKEGEIYSKIRNLILKPKKINSNYFTVTLYKKGIKKYYRLIHRLIAITWIPNINNYKEVNHLNGNRIDNNQKNLEWCTRSQNLKHSYEYLNRKGYWKNKFCENHHSSKKIEQSDLLGNIIKLWIGATIIEKSLKFKAQNIRGCCRGNQKTSYGFKWSYIS